MPPGNFILVDFLLTHVVGATHQAQTCTGTAHIWMIQPCLRKIDGTVCQTWQPYARHPNPGSRPFFLDPLNFDIQRSCRIPPTHPKPVPWRPKADLQQPRCDLGRPRCRWEAAKKRGWAKWGPCEAGLGGKAWETHQFFREKPWNPWVINYIGKWISTWLYDYQWDDVGWAWWFQDPRISCRRSRRTMTAWILWCLAKS